MNQGPWPLALLRWPSVSEPCLIPFFVSSLSFFSAIFLSSDSESFFKLELSLGPVLSAKAFVDIPMDTAKIVTTKKEIIFFIKPHLNVKNSLFSSYMKMIWGDAFVSLGGQLMNRTASLNKMNCYGPAYKNGLLLWNFDFVLGARF